jgi:hypothetical protein
MAPIAYIVEFSSFNLAVTVLPAGARNITAAQHKGANVELNINAHVRAAWRTNRARLRPTTRA